MINSGEAGTPVGRWFPEGRKNADRRRAKKDMTGLRGEVLFPELYYRSVCSRRTPRAHREHTQACDTLRFMPTDHIVTLLIAERARLSRAIEVLQGPIKRRGRSAKNPLTAITANATVAEPGPVRKKRTFTIAQRKEQAARMKKYWAAKKKAK